MADDETVGDDNAHVLNPSDADDHDASGDDESGIEVDAASEPAEER